MKGRNLPTSYRTVAACYKERIRFLEVSATKGSYRELVEAVPNSALIYINNRTLIGSVHCSCIFHCVGWQQFVFVLINRSWLVPQSAGTYGAGGGGEGWKGGSNSFALRPASPKLFMLSQYKISDSTLFWIFDIGRFCYFLDYLTLEDGTDRLFRNFGMVLLLDAA